MKKCFEEAYHELSDAKTPAKSYVEKKLEAVEKGEMRAEKLSDVVNYREDEASELRPVWDVNGSLKAMKASVSVALPKDTEELRARLALLGTAWLMVGFQQTANPLLKGLTPFVFGEYVDHLLGPHIWGLASRGAEGRVVSSPSWPLLLQYEQEVRNHAYFLMEQKAMPLARALRESWRDEVVKGRYFITPLALEHREYKRLTPPDGEANKPQKFQKLGRAGKGDKGKGKGKGAPEGCKPFAASGKRICFEFNRQGAKCPAPKGKCRFLHICGRCEKEGVPMYECKHA